MEKKLSKESHYTSRDYSYTCNDNMRSKYKQSKWKKIRPIFCNSKNFDLKSRWKNVIDIKHLLDKINVPFFMSAGALLGIVRDGGFLPWDDDVDLDIFDNIFKKNYDEICEGLISLGFIVRGRNLSYKNSPAEKVNLYRKKEKVNIRGMYLQKDDKGNEYRRTSGYRFPSRFWDKTSTTISFKGEIFNVPGPIEEYFIYNYGKNWKVPVKDKSICKKDWIKREISVPKKYRE